MSVFVDAAIDPSLVSEMIRKHQSKTAIGAHEIFLGQVRADEIEGKTVTAIEFSGYQEMADQEIKKIKEEAFEKFSISCAHVKHSQGAVAVGEICFLVFVSAPHRQAAREAAAFMVDNIKSRAPIFGKEIFEDASHKWKVNR